jgi:hypothetical protein
MAQQLAGGARSPRVPLGSGGHQEGVIWMPDTEEIPEIREITEEEGKKDQDLLADPSKGNEGILDDEDPEKFVTLEAEAAEGVILAEDVEKES